MTYDDILTYKTANPTGFNFKDKSSEVYNNIKILFYAGRDSAGKVRYAAECFCGNYFLIGVSNLSPSNTRRSCGCFMLKKSVSEEK
jgi:hypothetical protein